MVEIDIHLSICVRWVSIESFVNFFDGFFLKSRNNLSTSIIHVIPYKCNVSGCKRCRLISLKNRFFAISSVAFILQAELTTCVLSDAISLRVPIHTYFVQYSNLMILWYEL